MGISLCFSPLPTSGGSNLTKNMKAVAVLLLAGLALASASALPKSAKSSPVHKLSYKQAMKAKGIGCDICTLVVTEIDKLIVANETMDTIVETVEQLFLELMDFSLELAPPVMLLLKHICPRSLRVLLTTNCRQHPSAQL